MPTLPLLFQNGHLFVEIEQRFFLIDTGAPTSFGEGAVLNLDGRAFPLPASYQGLTAAWLSARLGQPVAGLLGTDILHQFDTLLDVPAGRITFSSEPLLGLTGDCVAIDSLMGVPILTVMIGGTPRRMFFDTGAQLSYFQDEALENFPFLGRITDFYPGLGEFETDTHAVELELGLRSYRLRCGRLPDLLGLTLLLAEVAGIIGNEWLQECVVGYFPRRQHLVIADRPHATWAAYYDEVHALSFGNFYQNLTETTVTAVSRLLTPPATIVDFGAGTGRLTLPLAAAGYTVTAVEPCRQMLDQLQANAQRDNLPVRVVCQTMQSFHEDGQYDLALSVFTVVAYLLDERDLTRALQALARALRVGGLLLLDIPSRQIFRDYEFSNDHLLRTVRVTAQDEVLYRYEEQTELQQAGRTVRYSDHFLIRYWEREQVLNLLTLQGFVLRQDLSQTFAGTGAYYWLLEKQS